MNYIVIRIPWNEEYLPPKKINISPTLVFHKWVDNEIMKKSKRKSHGKSEKKSHSIHELPPVPPTTEETAPDPDHPPPNPTHPHAHFSHKDHKDHKRDKAKKSKKSKRKSRNSGEEQGRDGSPNSGQNLAQSEAPDNSVITTTSVTVKSTPAGGMDSNPPQPQPPPPTNNPPPPVGGDLRKVSPESGANSTGPPPPPPPLAPGGIGLDDKKEDKPLAPILKQVEPDHDIEDTDDYLEIHHRAPVISRKCQVRIWLGVGLLLFIIFGLFFMLGYYLSFGWDIPPAFIASKAGPRRHAPNEGKGKTDH